MHECKSCKMFPYNLRDKCMVQYMFFVTVFFFIHSLHFLNKDTYICKYVFSVVRMSY